MATITKFGKFLGLMPSLSAWLFMLGCVLMAWSKGFGPCGPLDGFAALGFLFAALAALTLTLVLWASFAIEILRILVYVHSPVRELQRAVVAEDALQQHVGLDYKF
jgi:hypothetical protein